MSARVAKRATDTLGGPKPKDAMDLVDEMTESVTLNKFFDDNPSKFTDEDLKELIGYNRRTRAERVSKGEDEE